MSSASTKNYIDFKNMDGFVQTMVIAKIEEVLKIAGKHGGHVYGGYVRGVLVPRSKDPKCPVSFKDVDLWFQTKEQADAFIQEMGSAFVDHKHHFEATIKYAFDRQTYHYYVHETCVAWFDIVISKVFPVNDFDVNCLTFLFDGEETRKCVWTVRSSIETIEQHILAKEARLLEEPNEDNEPLIRRLVKSQGENILTPITTRFRERYAKQGWKIMLGDQLCSFEIHKSHNFLGRVLQYLQPSPPVPCAADETVVSSDTVDPASVLPPVSSAEEDPVSEEPAYSASDFCCRTNWFSGTCVHSCAKKEEPAASVPTESVDPASTLPPVSSAEEDTLPPLEPMASDEDSAVSIYVNAPEINDSVHLKVRIPIDRTSDASYIPVSIYVSNKTAPSAPPAAAPASAKEEEPAVSPSDKIIKDKDSSTPLYSAYVAVDKEMVKVLLEPVNRFVIDKVNDQFQVRGRHCIRSRQIVSLTPSEVEKAKQLGFQVPSANLSQKLKDLKVMLRLASLASQLESTIGPVSRVESYRDFIRLGLVESGRRPSIHGRRPSILPARFWY